MGARSLPSPSPPGPPFCAGAGEILLTWRTRLAELLEAGGVAAGRGVPLASSLIAACEGAVILSRAERSMEPFDQATDEQLQRIRAELAATGAA